MPEIKKVNMVLNIHRIQSYRIQCSEHYSCVCGCMSVEKAWGRRVGRECEWDFYVFIFIVILSVPSWAHVSKVKFHFHLMMNNKDLFDSIWFDRNRKAYQALFFPFLTRLLFTCQCSFHSLVSRQTFQRALTALVDIKSDPSVRYVTNSSSLEEDAGKWCSECGFVRQVMCAAECKVSVVKLSFCDKLYHKVVWTTYGVFT